MIHPAIGSSGGIRTHTGLVLSQLALPVGVRSLKWQRVEVSIPRVLPRMPVFKTGWQAAAVLSTIGGTDGFRV